MNEILVASRNPGKIREYAALLEPLGFRVLSLIQAADFPETPETGATFSENAILKGVAAFRRFHIPTLADDSGLEVFSLGGKPGVFSARFSPEGTDQKNNERLIRELKGITDRRARFVCTIAFFQDENHPVLFEGFLEGQIVDDPKGDEGFGYDPHFFIPAIGKTMAELSLFEKNTLSHRSRALSKMVVFLGAKR
ncbi:MAG TPA: RdgB/HAM1 family non-canonical purine NTP pyrophosphatase [Candidatus Izemoplasmatales bacterium]|nr:RdgB/HAM1 family non-canonical purine NTP pyrophosphatase [Bacillota bacterium]HRY78114.1 RdgB/HAM1 family non-canonical purine NTP pyrophosphatase [Candidatus Izemoplasmatales bacterium]